jgi:hypothetical protein
MDRKLDPRARSASLTAENESIFTMSVSERFTNLLFEDCALLKNSIPLGPGLADLRCKRPGGLPVLARPEPLFGNRLKCGQVERSSERVILIQFDAAPQLSAQFLDTSPHIGQITVNALPPGRNALPVVLQADLLIVQDAQQGPHPGQDLVLGES